MKKLFVCLMLCSTYAQGAENVRLANMLITIIERTAQQTIKPKKPVFVRNQTCPISIVKTCFLSSKFYDSDGDELEQLRRQVRLHKKLIANMKPKREK